MYRAENSRLIETDRDDAPTQSTWMIDRILSTSSTFIRAAASGLWPWTTPVVGIVRPHLAPHSGGRLKLGGPSGDSQCTEGNSRR